MLATPTSSSPKRPPPPSKLSFRRSLAVDNSTPPPPYDQHGTDTSTTSATRQLEAVFGKPNSTPVTTLLGSSVVATAQMLGFELPKTEQTLTFEDEQLLQQKSREELFELLRNAEQIIRTHETELNLAALAGEALLRENTRLRTRHDSLAARIRRVGSSESLRFLPSSLRTTRSRSGSLEQHLVPSVPPTPGSELPPPVTPQRQPGHNRRLSASPETIAALNVQNEELHTRLEKLISDATQTDQEGKRKLRQLQKEIEGLKSELDTSQKRNQELEAEAHEGRMLGTEQLRKEREEREEKLWALRTQTKVKDSDDQIKDYAPGNFVASSSTRSSLGSMPSASSASSLHAIPFPSSRPFSSELETIPADEEGEEEDQFASTRQRVASCTPQEYTLLSQILAKMKELETANKSISQQHREMNEKIERARQEADEIRSVYDSLHVDEVDMDDEEVGSAGTLRFFSLRSSGSLRDAFKRVGAEGDAGSDDSFRLPDSPTPSGNGNPRIVLSKPRKIRRPLDQLFLPSLSYRSKEGAGSPAFSEDSQRTTVPLDLDDLPPVPPPSEVSSAAASRLNSVKLDVGETSSPSRRRPRADSDDGITRSASFLGMNFGSTFPSFASFLGQQVRGRTLSSELGSEFGDDWRDGGLQDSFDAREGNPEDSAFGEHPAMAALRRALDPLNAGRTLDEGEHILPPGSLAQAPGEAFNLLARAVAARPQRWAAPAGREPTGPPRARSASTPIDYFGMADASVQAGREDPWETTRYPERVRSRRNTALGRMAATLTRRLRGEAEIDATSEADEFEVVAPEEAREHRGRATERVKAKVQARSTALLVEVWLFLQFVVVIVTFVWIMARKGPRAVMGDVNKGVKQS